MKELDMIIEWLKTKDSAFLDTTDVPKVISLLEELKELRKCVKSNAFVDGYEKGRADAIDECINKFKQRNCIDTKCKIRECSKCIVYMLMEQLKEQKNE